MSPCPAARARRPAPAPREAERGAAGGAARRRGAAGSRLAIGCALIPLLLASALHGADPVQVAPDLPPVPNPFGFDDRLALRTHLEDELGQRDVAGLELPALVERYRALVRPPAPAPAPERTAPTGDPGADRARRINLELQLERQFGIRPPPDAPLEELQRMVDAQVEAQRAQAPAEPDPPAVPRTGEAAPPAELTAVPAVQTPVPTIAGLELADPTGVIRSGIITVGDRRCLAACFSPDLMRTMPTVLAVSFDSLRRAPSARTALILLGHGDGTRIGVDVAGGVELVRHLRANRASYEAAAGGTLECVLLISCSPGSDTQFLAFRDGLGYYPEWRVSGWEFANQTIGSALAAFDLAVSRPHGERLRAVVYHGRATDLASMGEVGERIGTTWHQVDFHGDRMEITETKRR